MYRFIIRFSIILIVCFAVLTIPVVRSYGVEPFNIAIASVAGHLIDLFGGTVRMHQDVLAIEGFAVRIMEPCNALEATVILFAAMLAYPTSWVHKLRGLLVGVVAIHGLNLLRVISLLYLGAYDRDVFDWAHEYVWELLIMLDLLVVFLAWLWLLPSDSEAAPAL